MYSNPSSSRVPPSYFFLRLDVMHTIEGGNRHGNRQATAWAADWAKTWQRHGQARRRCMLVVFLSCHKNRNWLLPTWSREYPKYPARPPIPAVPIHAVASLLASSASGD
ncbi:uncharacterized protein MCYG_05976 [Microsporum canis CBS 113480]|uniref:Uncharacterized protein n=1 Tax=Arthroderma otae (strain ATCC MYA-4605 / CBS 113480) TaxID=554155 RepID=C5FTF4_ARTOC|nr:uncharacterized protein MCYG_05976 [Microsporum canis CBS 113480]EEQ33157.1 predicted protein [Microsporum canis CBS 113480]